MTKGVVFFIYGAGHSFLMKCAIWSLRTVYDGPLHILHYKADNDVMAAIAALPNTTVSEYVPDMEFINPGKANKKIAAWCMKAHGHLSQYPFDLNLYYDLDHVWLRPIDMSIFDKADKHGLVNPWNHYNKTSRLRQVLKSPHVPRIEKFITANGGCVCAKRGSKEVQQWMDLIKLNTTCDNKIIRKNPEEIALAIMLSDGRAEALTAEWSTKLGKIENPIAIHHAKNRYIHDQQWVKQVQAAWESGFLDIDKTTNATWIKRIWGKKEG